MFVIRGKNGEIITSSEIETDGQEITYRTREEARKALKELERSMPTGFFQIEEAKCMNCGETHDVIDFYSGDDYVILCANCRQKLAMGQLGKIGRPSMGTTKKVSLTLSDDMWNWLDEKAEGNRSKFLREVVANAYLNNNKELGNESEWSNNACLGYVILGAKKLGYDDEQIQDLVRAMYVEFDMKTVDEAKDTYNQSSY